MSTVFTKIINGELPCYKIYEDDKVFSFLDNNPVSKGNTLVIPKVEVDKIYDLPDDYYNALMQNVKRLAAHMEKVTGRRTLMKIIGTDVPHAHVHLMPQSDTWEYGKTLDLTPEEFEEIRTRLEFKA